MANEMPADSDEERLERVLELIDSLDDESLPVALKALVERAKQAEVSVDLSELLSPKESFARDGGTEDRKRRKRSKSTEAIEFGKRLSKYRKHAGKTLTELAEISGIAAPQISKYEDGWILPSIETQGKLATALGLAKERLTQADNAE